MATTAMPQTSVAGRQHIHPAGATSQMVTKTPDELSPEIKELVSTLNRFAHASTVEEHRMAMKSFDDDVSVDTPFMYVVGKDRVRVLSSFLKYMLGKFDIDPKVVRIQVVDDKRAQLDIDSVVHYLPHRPWYLPLTWLLPYDVPIHATLSLGVKGWNDKVSFVSGKTHNLPHVPRLLRLFNGWVAGTTATVAEPIYFQLLDWYSAGWENVQRGTHAVQETAASGFETARDTTSSVASGITQTTGNITSKIADTASNITSTVVDTASNITSRAAETVGLKKD